jgi:molybdopterin synthase sulfur carrier subunit
MEKGRMKVRSYGKIADILGHEREIEIAGSCTVAELRALLAADCPEADRILADGRVRACVDDAIVHDDHVLEPGDSIDLLAPVSGG